MRDMEPAAVLEAARAALAERAGLGTAQEGASSSAAHRRGSRGGKEEEEEVGERGREVVTLRQRLGRARRRAGPGTPSPSWKLEEEVEAEGEAEAGEGAAAPVHPAVAPARRSTASASASARQLGASLWEIHDVTREGRRDGARRRRSGKVLADGGHGGAGIEVHEPQSSGGFDRHHHADPSMHHHKLHQERNCIAQPFSPASYTSSIGDSSINQAVSPARSLDIRGRSRGAGYNLKTSTELLRVLNRIWSLEERHTANMSVVKGLKLELHQAQEHIKELMQERRGYHHEVASLTRQLSEDKPVQKIKDQEKIEATFRSLQDELEDERCLRRHSEDLHRKFGKELSQMKSAFLKAVKDLEKEKKTNSLLENLCDQFAMGIRDYEEEVRLLKQRHANYDYKFDKSVLHISEVWLDERMQMQNIDVNEDLPQKAAITERLSSEIQAFLLAKRSASSKNYTRRDASLRRQSLESVHLNGATSAPQLAEDDDSVDSDLHCFELDMHGNGIQNHDHAGPHRSRTRNLYAPKRRTEYSCDAVGESSHSSHVQTCSLKDKARSSSSKQRHGINSQNNAVITTAEEQNEIICAHNSRGSHNDSSKNNLEAPRAECLGQESLDHFSRTSLFCEGTTSGDLCNLHSPSQQLNYQSNQGNEIAKCSPELPVSVKENTLKEKLLQARLEGRHARLRASGGSITSRRK